MFFPHLITKIAGGDKVLEIGPGAHPFPRSDVLLELQLADETEYARQFGHMEKLVTDKRVIFYDGKTFPFRDHEFDYVICSHVLEHVPDVKGFLGEVFRVGKKGYFEYPLITYEYLYNFDVHLNFLKWDGAKILYRGKDRTRLDEFRPVQAFFLSTLQKDYHFFMKQIPTYFIEGFEWERPFAAEPADDLATFMAGIASVPPCTTVPPEVQFTFAQLTKALHKKIMRRICCRD